MTTYTPSMLAAREPYEVYRIAVDLFDSKDYLGAVAPLEFLLDRAPERELGDVRELLARAYFHTAQLDKAIDAARNLLDKDPGHGYAALLLARSLQRAGRADEAAAARRLAAALGADSQGHLPTH